MATPTLHLNGPGLNIHAWPGRAKTVTFTYTDENDDPITGSSFLIVVGGDNSDVGPIPDEGDGITYFTATEGDPGEYVAEVTYPTLGSYRMRVVIDDEPEIVGRLLVTSSDESSPTLTVPLQLTSGGTVAITLNGSSGTGSTAIPVSDDGSQVVEAVASFNFTGAGVTVTDEGDGAVEVAISGGGGSGPVAWGDLTGTLSAQTDLQSALDAKADASSLAEVATTGDYGDLDNLPTLGTAAAANTGDFDPAGAAAAVTTTSISAVPTSRTLAGLDLTANRSASDLRGALGTGTPSGSNFLRGDGTWSAASGSGWAPAEIMVPGHNLTSDIATSRRIGGSTSRTRVALPQADTLTGGVWEVGFGVVPHLPWTSVDVWVEWFHVSSSTADVVWRLYMGGQTNSHTAQTAYQVTATGTGGSGNDLTYGRRERVKIATAVSVTDTDYNSFNVGRLGTDGADTMSGTVYLMAVGFRAAGT